MSEGCETGGLHGAYRAFRDDGNGRLVSAVIAPIYYATARLLVYRLSAMPEVENDA